LFGSRVRDVDADHVVTHDKVVRICPRDGTVTMALADGLPPLNITGDVPGLGRGYSPLWASHPVVWDEKAERQLLMSEAQVRTAARLGQVHGFDGDVVRADGILVNCPVISRQY